MILCAAAGHPVQWVAGEGHYTHVNPADAEDCYLIVTKVTVRTVPAWAEMTVAEKNAYIDQLEAERTEREAAGVGPVTEEETED